MVVIAAAICKRSGEALVSRQFVDISRSKIESLLTNFTKLLANSNLQYTYINGKSTRFIYQPMDELYAVVVTDKKGNIVEDIEILQLIVSVISDICGVSTINSVLQRTFELVFAFDEIISMGYRGKAKLAQIKQFLSMDSQEEKMDEIHRMNLEREAQKEREMKIRELDQMHKLMPNKPSDHYLSSMNSGISSMDSFNSSIDPMDKYTTVINVKKFTPDKKTTSSNKKYVTWANDFQKDDESSIVAKTKSLSLKTNSIKDGEYLTALKQELRNDIDFDQNKLESSDIIANQINTTGFKQDDCSVNINEKIMVLIDRDSNLKHFEVFGELNVIVMGNNLTRPALHLEPVNLSEIETKLNPLYNRSKFTQNNVIEFADEKRKFVIGAPNPVFRWHFFPKGSSQLPLSINFWPSVDPSSGITSVNMDYEALPQYPLQDVLIKIPIVGKSNPKIIKADGTVKFDPVESCLEWSIPILEVSMQNLTGVLEFEVEQWKIFDNSLFYPITVNFVSNTTICSINVKTVTDGDQKIDFSKRSSLVVDSYKIN